MRGADGQEGHVELSYAQAAELYARAEARAALLRAAAAPERLRPRRRRAPARWRLAVPALAVVLASGVAVWTRAGSPPRTATDTLDAFTMGPTVARPQPSVGRTGTVAQLAPLLGFQVLLPHTRLANPRLLSGAWAGPMAGVDGGATVDGIALDFPASRLRVVEMPWAPPAEIGIPAPPPMPGGRPGRSAIVDGVLVRVVGLSGHHTAAQFDAVLRSLR